MHAVIFSGGQLTFSLKIQHILQKADLFIAADSGADAALKLHITPHVVVGDFDSIKPEVLEKLQKKKVVFVQYKTDKDETDTELALDYAVQQGATDITIVGGNNGDRFDHVMANIFLSLTCPVPLRFLNGNQEIWVEKGPVSKELSGKKGDLLSLIPLTGDVTNITLKGLQYLLYNETLLFGKPRGISNVFLGKTAHIQFAEGTLLIIQTHR